MPVGDLNKRILLQYETKVSDSMGGFTATWTDGDTIWAAIWPTSASEMIQSMQSELVVTHRIRIRYRKAFRATYRIKFGNRYFNIVSVLNPSERNEWLDLLCKEST